MRTATRCVFTTERAAELYRDRYPVAAEKCVVIENGYDEEAFVGNKPLRTDVNDDQIFMLHSGIIYPRDRDPSAFFAAIASLVESGKIQRQQLKIRFRAPHHGDEVAALASKFGLGDVVEIAPPIPYREAIGEMMGSDLLLVFQGAHFNSQIPAKIYEYLRTGRPILGLVDQAGDTASQLRLFEEVGLANISNKTEIVTAFQYWLDRRTNSDCLAAQQRNVNSVKRYSRASHTEKLAALFRGLR